MKRLAAIAHVWRGYVVSALRALPRLLSRLAKRAGQGLQALTRGLTVIALLLLAILIAFVIERERLGLVSFTYHIEARATGVSVTFAGTGNAWDLGEPWVCRPRDLKSIPRENLTSAAGDNAGTAAGNGEEAPCDRRRYETARERAVIQWRPGERAIIGWEPDGGLEVRARTCGGDGYPNGTVFVIDAKEWRWLGALAFVGSPVFGGEMGSGQGAYLVEGSFRVRQASVVSHFGADRRFTVLESSLYRGDRVAVVRRDGEKPKESETCELSEPGPFPPAVSYGHVTPAEEDDAGFAIVSASETGRTALSVNYIGKGAVRADESLLIYPSWLDSLIGDPFLLAIALILGFAANALQIVGSFRREQ